MKYSAEQVMKALTDGTAESKHWQTGEWTEGFSPDEYGWLEMEGVRLNIDDHQEIIKVVDETGGMDAGSDASVVIRVGDQLFRKQGYYQSHYGYDWDGDFSEVEPYARTVTDYRPI